MRNKLATHLFYNVYFFQYVSGAIIPFWINSLFKMADQKLRHLPQLKLITATSLIPNDGMVSADISKTPSSMP